MAEEHNTGQQSMTRATLYVFEGPDGVGKSAIARSLAEHIRSHDRRCDLFSFPGQQPGTLSEWIYRVYHNPSVYGITKIKPV